MDYEEIKLKTKALLEGETRFLPNAANFSSLLFNEIEGFNWVGFYLFDGNELVLGPFVGKPACITIGVGKGVCGNSFKNQETIAVDDVYQYPGYISCDPDAASELVIPLTYKGNKIGVFDIDSPLKSRFNEEDKINLEKLLNIFIECTKLPETGYLI